MVHLSGQFLDFEAAGIWVGAFCSLPCVPPPCTKSSSHRSFGCPALSHLTPSLIPAPCRAFALGISSLVVSPQQLSFSFASECQIYIFTVCFFISSAPQLSPESEPLFPPSSISISHVDESHQSLPWHLDAHSENDLELGFPSML